MNAPLTLVLTGAESSGKTTLAAALAGHFGVPWVPEFARSDLARRSRGGSADRVSAEGAAAADYSVDDVLAIAAGQQAAEADARAHCPGLLVVDTDLLVILIWLRERFGIAPAWIDAALQPQRDRAYVLTKPDMPWEPDPLREHPLARDRLHGLYRGELLARGLDFLEVDGEPAQRLASVERWLRQRRFCLRPDA